MCNIHQHLHPKTLPDTYNSSSSVLALFLYKNAPENNLYAAIITAGCHLFSIPSLHNKPKVGLDTQIFSFL